MPARLTTTTGCAVLDGFSSLDIENGHIYKVRAIMLMLSVDG